MKIVGGCLGTRGLTELCFVYTVTMLTLWTVLCTKTDATDLQTLCTLASFQLVVHLLIVVTYPMLENWYQTKLKNHQESARKFVSTGICRTEENPRRHNWNFCKNFGNFLKVKMSEVPRLQFADIWIRNWNVASVIRPLGSTGWHQLKLGGSFGHK